MSELTWFFLFWGFLFSVGFVEQFVGARTSPVPQLQRWTNNILFGLLNGFLFSLLPIGLVSIAEIGQRLDLGLLRVFEAPTLLLVIATVLIRDGAQYAFHRLTHEWPWLWQFHLVHHSDNHVDISTGLRFHPVEYLSNLVFVAPFVLVFGLPPEMLATFEIVSILIGLFSHANVTLPLSLYRAVRWVLTTPNFHEIHHSVAPEDFNQNYGVVLTIWDGLFHTRKWEVSAANTDRTTGCSQLPAPASLNFGTLIMTRPKASKRAEEEQ